MMSARDIVAHGDHQQHVLEGLSTATCIAFGAACLERQRLVYVRASDRQPWGHEGIPAFEQLLNHLWRAAKGSDVPWPTLAVLFPRLLPADEALITGPAMAAFTIGNALADFVSSIQNGKPVYAYLMAVRGFELIELLADDIEVDLEYLEREELLRQTNDLAALGAATPDVIQRLRLNTTGQSIFGSEWF